MRRITALLVLIAMAPAGARAGVSAPHKPTVPTQWIRSSESKPVAPAKALREAILSGKATLADVLRLRRAQLTAPVSAGGGGWHGVAYFERARANSTEDGIYRFPITTGDLNGDGRDEVLTLETDYISTLSDFLNGRSPATLVARAGGDGAVVWQVETDLYSLVRTADLDGDGADEVLILRDEALGTVGSAFVAGVGGFTLRQHVSAVRGDGSVAWERLYRGLYVLGFGFALVADAIVYGVVGAVDQVTPMADATGDDKRDVFVGSVDLVVALAFELVAIEYAEVDQYHGRTLSSVDGSEFAKTTTRGPTVFVCALLCAVLSSLPYIIPTSDLNGDGAADLLALSGKGLGDDMDGRSVDGKTKYWTVPGVDPYDVVPVQLDGTGPVDVLTYANAYNGADGSVLFEWSAWAIFQAGDINGDDGVDLMTINSVYDDQTNTETMTLAAISGADGAQLWQQPITPPVLEPGQIAWSFYCSCAADLDGDGLADLLTAVEIDDADFNFVDLSIAAHSGDDGSTIFTATGLTGYSQLPVPFGDQNGNGTADLVTFTLDENGYAASIDTAEGATNANVYSAPLDVAVGSAVWLNSLLTANVAGSSSEELIAGVDEYPVESAGTSEVETFQGSSLLWTV